MRAGQTGRVDERLAPLRVQAAAGSDEQRSDFGEHGGSFAFPPTVVSRPLSVGRRDPVATRTRPITMPTPQVQVAARVDKDHSTTVSGDLVITRTPQTDSITTSRAEFEQITLDAGVALKVG